MRGPLAVLLLACGAGCAPTPSPAAAAPNVPVAAAPNVPAAAVPNPPDPYAGLALAVVSQGRPFSAGELPTVVVAGTRIALDGREVGTTGPILDAGKPQRVDGLFDELRARHRAWKEAHPGVPSPGLARVAFDAGTSVVVVKSVLQTMGFAAFPEHELVVRRADGGLARLDVGVAVPGPGTEPERDPGHVEVVAGPRGYTVAWRRGREIESTFEVETEAQVRHRVSALLIEHDPARGGDRGRGHGVLYLSNGATFADLARALDAMASTLPAEGPLVLAPRFAVELALSETPSVVAPGSSGRLPPEVIQRIVRGGRDRMLACVRGRKGRVVVDFRIDPAGRTQDAKASESDLPEAATACVVATFAALEFPPPEGGQVIVKYPVAIDPTAR